MNASVRTAPATEWRRRLDAAALDLVRLVMTDPWDRERAAQQLRDRVKDDHVLLRSLRARIARARLERPTRVGARAAATVEAALAGHGRRTVERPALRGRWSA